jgi:hypothetical protein
VWLRGASRALGTEGYARLGYPAYRRIEHSRTFKPEYMSRINTLMRRMKQGAHGCDSERAERALAGAARQMINGSVAVHDTTRP